jgi:hypothetical protein
MNAPRTTATVVLVHGAWADGSSWTRVITSLQSKGLRVLGAPIPLTSRHMISLRLSAHWTPLVTAPELVVEIILQAVTGLAPHPNL